MPIRQRSPYSQQSSGGVFFPASAKTTTMPHHQQQQEKYRTMRSRNPDGSSTVYHVHDSVLQPPPQQSSTMPPPPPIITAPSPRMYYGNNSAVSGYNNETTNPFDPTLSALPTYAQFVPSSYSPYNHVNICGGYPQHQQHRQQQHNLQSPQSVVYVNNNEYWEDDYNMNKEDTTQEQQQQLVNYAAPSHSSPPWCNTYVKEDNDESVDESKLKRITKTWCSKNSTPCILLGMVFAIMFIIAYVFLVEAFVNRSRIARNANVTNVSLEKAYGDTYSGLRSVGRNSYDDEASSGVVGVEKTAKNSYGSTAVAAQLLPDMEPRYYVLDQILRPLDVGEVPPAIVAATPSSVPAEDLEEEDMVIPALVQAKHEPV